MKPPDQPTSPTPESDILKTNIVNNIPMHAPNAAPSAPPGDDADLDKIMKDVGHELEKNVKRVKKHHFFTKEPDQEQTAPPKQTPAPAAPVVHNVQPPPAVPVSTPQTPQSQPPTKVDANQKPSHPADKKSVPIFIILVTIIITGALAVAAVAAYQHK